MATVIIGKARIIAQLAKLERARRDIQANDRIEAEGRALLLFADGVRDFVQALDGPSRREFTPKTEMLYQQLSEILNAAKGST